ncbi:arsenate reductase ArsC [Tepidiphilus baoligensis]|nr:arsenate reductase ArsC [Tepidiphilus baoligensis]
MTKTVLVLCTHNACRSQLAQALLEHELAPALRAISAGTQPAQAVPAEVFAALRLAGIAAEDLVPKSLEAVRDEAVDLVVTVCDGAKETCPVFPRPVPRLHVSFPDPMGQPLARFLEVRDEIRARLVPAVCQALDAEREARP